MSRGTVEKLRRVQGPNAPLWYLAGVTHWPFTVRGKKKSMLAGLQKGTFPLFRLQFGLREGLNTLWSHSSWVCVSISWTTMLLWETVNPPRMVNVLLGKHRLCEGWSVAQRLNSKHLYLKTLAYVMMVIRYLQWEWDLTNMSFFSVDHTPTRDKHSTMLALISVVASCLWKLNDIVGHTQSSCTQNLTASKEDPWIIWRWIISLLGLMPWI